MQKQAPPTLKCFEKAVFLNSRHCYIIEKVCTFEKADSQLEHTIDAHVFFFTGLIDEA